MKIIQKSDKIVFKDKNGVKISMPFKIFNEVFGSGIKDGKISDFEIKENRGNCKHCIQFEREFPGQTKLESD